MPVKSVRTKKPVSPEVEKPESEEEEVIDLRSRASKKPAEFDLPESSIMDDESKEDSLLQGEESDELSSDDTLDEEELNPFGDKWEM